MTTNMSYIFEMRNAVTFLHLLRWVLFALQTLFCFSEQETAITHKHESTLSWAKLLEGSLLSMLDSEDTALEDLLTPFLNLLLIPSLRTCACQHRLLPFFVSRLSISETPSTGEGQYFLTSEDPAIGEGGSSYPSPIVSVQKLSALVTPHVLRTLYN